MCDLGDTLVALTQGCGFGITLLIIQGPLNGADDEVRRDDWAWMFRSFYGSDAAALTFLVPGWQEIIKWKWAIKTAHLACFGLDFWLHKDIPDFCDLWVQQRYDTLLDNVSILLEPVSWCATIMEKMSHKCSWEGVPCCWDHCSFPRCWSIHLYYSTTVWVRVD